MRSRRSISPTDCSDETRRLRIARRFGSAMISNTDSTLRTYSTAHMLVKAYTSGTRATGCRVHASPSTGRLAARPCGADVQPEGVKLALPTSTPHPRRLSHEALDCLGMRPAVGGVQP